tara:strand:+ start:745 stop:996 length:252 start_codon:yes stop_codon:yes gene_type:complete
MEVNKSLPIALILGLATQGAAIIWTVSMMAADIEDNAEKITELQQRIGRVEDAVHSQAIAMARIDENIKAIRGFVEKIATADK